jgi:hypothetical protein
MFDDRLPVVPPHSRHEPLSYAMAPRTVPTSVSRATNPGPSVHNGATPILSQGERFPMGLSPCAVPSKALLQRVRAEYQEMSSLRLTPSQAQRLFGLEPLMCSAVLEALLHEHFLTRTSAGLFVQSPMP